MILTVIGYLVLSLLAWSGCYVLIFTASRAWHDGKAQAKSDTIQEIRRCVFGTSLNTNEIATIMHRNTDRIEMVQDLTRKLLNVTSSMNKAAGELIQLEANKLEGFGGGDPPVPPTLVS